MPEAGIKGRDKKLHPRDTVECNYLSLLLMPASGTEILIYRQVSNISRTLFGN